MWLLFITFWNVMWLCVTFRTHILNKMWSLFKRKSKYKLCQIKCKCTQITKYKCTFQTQIYIALQLQIHTQLKMCLPNQPEHLIHQQNEYLILNLKDGTSHSNDDRSNLFEPYKASSCMIFLFFILAAF